MHKSSSIIRSKLARRIFLLFVLCALLPVCALATVAAWQISSRIHQQSIDALRRQSKDVGMTIFSGLTLLQSQLQSAAITAGSVGKPAEPPLLSLPAGQIKGFISFTVLTEDLPSAAPLASLFHSQELRDHFLQNESVLFFSPDKAGKTKLYLAKQIPNSGPGLRLLAGEVNPEYLPTLISYAQPDEVDILVFNANGLQIYGQRAPTKPSRARALLAQLAENTGHLEWQEDGSSYLAHHWKAYLYPLYRAEPWTILAIQPKAETTLAAQAFVKPFALILGLAMGVVILASSIQIRRSLVPLALLREGAQKISRGDFNSRLSLPCNDEFADLAETFNDMSNQLQHQFCTVKEMSHLVQNILQAYDLDKILDTVLTNFRKIIACEWLSICLMNNNSRHTGRMVSNRYSHKILSPTKTSVVVFSEPELTALESAGDSLRIPTDNVFAKTLTPMIKQGAEDFVLLPIRIKSRLVGLLTLGFRQPQASIDDDLIRARQIADEIAVALDNIRLINELQSLNWGTIEALAKAVDAKSPWTAGHSERVTQLALQIGRQLELDKPQLEQLHWAGLFHDIGKIAIPGTILDKPNKLSTEEYALMQSHPQKGADILQPIKAYRSAIPIIAQHHEWFDGNGYPAGLRQEQICIGARILAVADAYDALFSDRPYRAGWDRHRVLAYLDDKAGSQFDPAVVRAFMKVLPAA